jgi:hypothetical protein
VPFHEDRFGLRLGAALLLTGLACGGSQPVPPDRPPPPDVEVPEWVNRTPRMPGNVCAVGAVDPTYFRQDGRVQAAESARTELARTIQVKITSVMYDEQDNRGTYVDQSIVSEVIGTVSEGVIAGAEVLEYWFDEYGNVSRKGMTYALACMKTDTSVAELAAKLEAAYPKEEEQDKVEAVKERARLAFEELEKMEASHAAPAPAPSSTGTP